MPIRRRIEQTQLVLDGTQLIVSSTISPQVCQRQDVTVLHLLMIMYRFNFFVSKQIILCKVTKKNKFGGFRIFYWAVFL